MYRKSFTALLSLLVGVMGILGAVSFQPHTAHADGIGVIPPRFDIFGNPGDILNEKLKVQNQSNVDVTYSIDVQDFTANGDQGNVAILDPGTKRTTFSLASWITVEPTNFTVAANDEAVLTFQVKIPKSGEPGGHYASILIRRNGQTTPGGAAVDSRVGSLILLRVSGAVTENLSIDGFASEKAFAQYSPISLDLRLKNTGNVHDAPKGTIVITNMFGKKVAELPIPQNNVLPGADRVIKTILDQKGLIGRYTATLVATYGDQNKTLSATTTFIVFPLYILWIIIGIIVLIFLLITQRKGIKRFINRLTSD